MASSYTQNIAKGVIEHVVTLTGAETATTTSLTRFDGFNYPDKSVQVTAHSAGVVTIQGNNATTSGWVGLVDPQGNAISFSGIGIEQILENPRYIRVLTSGGTATDVVEVRFLCK